MAKRRKVTQERIRDKITQNPMARLGVFIESGTQDRKKTGTRWTYGADALTYTAAINLDRQTVLDILCKVHGRAVLHPSGEELRSHCYGGITQPIPNQLPHPHQFKGNEVVATYKDVCNGIEEAMKQGLSHLNVLALDGTVLILHDDIPQQEIAGNLTGLARRRLGQRYNLQGKVSTGVCSYPQASQ